MSGASARQGSNEEEEKVLAGLDERTGISKLKRGEISMKTDESLKRGKDHLGLGDRSVPRTVLLPGDPDRVDEIAKLWDGRMSISNQREYRLVEGRYRGVELAACSTGIGGGSTEIAIIELFHHGARDVIRVGTAGGVAPGVASGDLVVLTGCVRKTGAADAFVPIEFPAIADYRILNALLEACEELGLAPYVGLGATVDSYYATKPHLIRGDGLEFQTSLYGDLRMWRECGILQLDMETAVIFVLAAVLGMRAGSICTVGANLFGEGYPAVTPSNRNAIEAACRAAVLLAGKSVSEKDG
jgi:uridine phosphorylase